MVKSPAAPYDLHTSVAHLQAILGNFEARTGRTLEAWTDLVLQQGPEDAKGQQAWLKAQGLGTQQTKLVLQRLSPSGPQAFDDTPEGYLAAAPGYVAAQYGGTKAALRPLFEQVLALVRALGTDVKVCPCQTLVPFYRNHVFADVKPFASRLDLGLALGDPAGVADPQGLLKETGGFAKKDRLTHKLELRSEADLRAALPWLKRAYERDGA
jgi:predicted transport protein